MIHASWGLGLVVVACVLVAGCEGGAPVDSSNDGGGAGSGGDGACASDEDMSAACRAERLEACSMVALDICDEREHCQTLEARPVDSEADCVSGGPQLVGCGIIGCTAANTVAEDPEGGTWLFSSGCLPFGWEEMSFNVPDSCD